MITAITAFADNEVYTNTTVSNLDFSNSSMVNADFSSSTIRDTNFTGADLTNSSFLGSKLYDTNFTNANLSGSFIYFDIIENVSFDGAIINNSYISSYNGGLTTEHIKLVKETASFRNKNISGVSLMLNGGDENVLNGVDFTDFNLQNTVLFSGSTTIFKNADITGAEIYNLTTKQLSETLNYKNKDFSGIKIINGNFEDIKLSGFAFGSVNFANSSFNNADFSYSKFSGQLLNISYIGANFSYADLSNVTFSGDFTNANFSNAKNFSAATFSFGFQGNATIKGANFSNTDITFRQIYNTRSYYTNYDLGGINLSGTDMSNANFQFQNLEGATFENTNLRNAWFYASNLKNASFKNADLTGATFYRTTGGNYFISGEDAFCDISGADFTDAIITNVNFRLYDGNENLFKTKGFSISQLYSTASYKNKDLRGINISSSTEMDYFIGANFDGQNLSGSIIDENNFTNASFKGANLTGVRLVDSNIANADFSDAVMTNVVFNNGLLGETKIDAKGAKFINADFSNSTYDKYHKASINNADLTAADFRNSDLKIGTGNTTKHTILQDGTMATILDISEQSESFHIRKYNGEKSIPVVMYGEIHDGTLTLDTGAEVKVITALGLGATKWNENGTSYHTDGYIDVGVGATLLFENSLFVCGGSSSDGSELIINTNLNSDTVVKFCGTSEIYAPRIRVNLTEDIIANDSYVLAILSWEDDARMTELDYLVLDKTLFLDINNSKYTGEWNYIIKNNTLYITIGQTVPEPATCAAIFGALALAFAAYRRRK